ncbi:MAG: hypothetical protein M3160_00610 [Candidatus Eremiobacteraeota bacterium]|nr:hypothetical protein [Candidatus Eremiobacteraeota bacterium]
MVRTTRYIPVMMVLPVPYLQLEKLKTALLEVPTKLELLFTFGVRGTGAAVKVGFILR